MNRAAKATLTAFVACLAAPVCAAEEDTQLWTAAMAMVDVPRGPGRVPLVVMADTQYRYFGNASRLGQNQVRASLGIPVIGRTRLEERFLEGSSDMAVRARQMVRVNAPLGRGFVAIGTSELFVNLNSADWGPRAGFDQLRLFGGIGVPIARGLWIEAGYMNQYVARHARADRMNHNISLTLSLVR